MTIVHGKVSGILIIFLLLNFDVFGLATARLLSGTGACLSRSFALLGSRSSRAVFVIVVIIVARLDSSSTDFLLEDVYTEA